MAAGNQQVGSDLHRLPGKGIQQRRFAPSGSAGDKDHPASPSQRCIEVRVQLRQLVFAPDEEWAVRFAGYRVQQAVVAQSGKDLGAVDWFFFNYIRSHCPEMTDPVCSECALEAVCKKRKEYFQPVLRTTFY